MNPIEQLMIASRGHQGLPMQIDGPGGPDQAGAPPASMGGGLPAGLPPSAPTSPGGSGGNSDRQVADSAAQHLLALTHEAHDPALKAAFTTALAALHKYIVGADKEHQQALQGKFSPRLMAQGSQH